MREIRKLSNSSLERFASCPLSYFHAYVNSERPKKQDTTDFYAEFGIIIHFLAEMYPRLNFYQDMEFGMSSYVEGDGLNEVLNSYGNQLVARGNPLSLKEMLVIYEELFPLINFPDQEKQAEYYQQGLDYINGMPDQDWSQIVGLEQEFSFTLDESVPPVVGFIDKVERDEKGLVVTDYKTSKPYSKNAILKKDQLPIYGMACYILYGEFPYKYGYDFVRFGKVTEVEIPEDRLVQVKNIIKFKFAQMSSYKRHGAFPATYNSFYCKNFCGYAHICETFKQFNE